MRRERWNRGRDGVPEHIVTLVNNSPSPPRGVRRNWVSEDTTGRVTEGWGDWKGHAAESHNPDSISV